MGNVPSHIQAEQEKWNSHSLDIAPGRRDAALELLKTTFQIDEKISLCSFTRDLAFVKYRHYFLQCRDFFLEFDGPDIYSSSVLLHNNVKTAFQIEDTRTIDVGIRSRIKQVCGATNYSLFLRNCEHLARFVLYDEWLSNQTVDRGALAGLFLSFYERQTSNFLNRRPLELASAGGTLKQLHKKRYEKLNFITNSRIMTKGENSINVVFLGPTGCGKSYLINKLLNRDVLTSEASLYSVTLDLAVVKCTGNIRGVDQRVNLIDTVGLCDTRRSAFDVLNLLKSHVRHTVCRVNLFVVCVPHRLTKEEKESMVDVLNWLKMTGNGSHFVFVYTKASLLSRESWERMSSDLIRVFKVPKLREKAPTHNIQYVELGASGSQTIPERMEQELEQILDRIPSSQMRFDDSCQIL